MDIDHTAELVDRVRARNPLVHNITNYVAMNNSANAVLAIGASPAMGHAVEEVEDLVAIASALVVNIGTLDPYWVDGMKRAAAAANARPIPWILDPVGNGATGYRTATATELGSMEPTVIRGNASEIMVLAGAMDEKPQGVDSRHGAEVALDAARALARRTGGIVAVTGVTDLVTDGSRLARIDGGHSMMPFVTGLGCSASALVGAFAAVEDDAFAATVAALAAFGAAGHSAGNRAAGPGSLQQVLLDDLYRLDRAMLHENCRIRMG